MVGGQGGGEGKGRVKQAGRQVIETRWPGGWGGGSYMQVSNLLKKTFFNALYSQTGKNVRFVDSLAGGGGKGEDNNKLELRKQVTTVF